MCVPVCTCVFMYVHAVHMCMHGFEYTHVHMDTHVCLWRPSRGPAARPFDPAAFLSSIPEHTASCTHSRSLQHTRSLSASKWAAPYWNNLLAFICCTQSLEQPGQESHANWAASSQGVLLKKPQAPLFSAYLRLLPPRCGGPYMRGDTA